MFKVNKKNQQNNVNDVVLVSLLLSLNRSHNCSGVSIFDFEHKNAGWDNSCWKFSNSRDNQLHFFNRIIVLENWQNSQEDTCGGFFLVKLQTRLTTLLKQDTILDVFLLTLRNCRKPLATPFKVKNDQPFQRTFYLNWMHIRWQLGLSTIILYTFNLRKVFTAKERVKKASLQTRHVYSTLKQRGNDRFCVVLTWNRCGAFVGK